MVILTRKGQGYFSLTDANRALAYLGRNAVGVAKLYREIERHKMDMDTTLKRRKDPKSDKAALSQLWELYAKRREKTQDELRVLAFEIIEIGAKIDDLGLGLISFPSKVVEPDLTRWLFTWMQRDGDSIRLWRREKDYVEKRVEIPDWVH